MINTDNYELYFFQYQEDMLDESARREVEAFMALHPELAEEMTLYAEAPVLTAEEVSFPDKNSLRRTVVFPWWRYAAAAAVVVGIGTTVMFTLPRQEPSADQPLVARVESVARPTQQPQSDTILVEKRAALPSGAERQCTQRPTVQPAESIAECVREQVAQEVVGEPEWESVEVDVFDSQMLVGEPCEPLLAEVEAPVPSQAREPRSQEPEIIIHDRYETSWVELLADRYPEQAMQVTRGAVKAVTVAERLRNHPVVKFLQSIV